MRSVKLFAVAALLVALASSSAENVFASAVPHVAATTVPPAETMPPSQMKGVHMTLWDDSDTRYKEVYFDWLKSYGINAIMINFGWNKLEPTKGSYDQNYLGKMDRFIQKAKARNIYVILRMQKWAYPNAYQAQSPGNAWILGYPAWLNDTPDFWENVGNCWNNYVAMWTMLAARYKNESYAAGFNLFGEPGNDVGPVYGDANWFNSDSNACRKVMRVLFDDNRLYERTINSIHSIAANKLVIIEGFDGSTLRYIKNVGDAGRTVPRKPNSENFAIGESVYEDFQFPWLDEQKSIATAWNVPFIATEFGVQVAVIDSPEPEKVTWVQQACQAFAARNMGWFYWEFGPGPNGDYNLVNENDGSVSPILCRLSPPQNTFVSLSAHLVTDPPTAIISGSVYSNSCGPVNVTLEYSNNQGASYQEITRITSATNGSFSYIWRLPDYGIFTIRADAQGVKSSPVSIEASGGIPGFPLESLLIGGALGIILGGLGRRRRLHFSRRLRSSCE